MRPRPEPWQRWIWLVSVALGLAAAGCTKRGGPTGADDPQRPAQQVIMEPLHIGLEPDPQLGLTDFDAATLFHEGLRLHEAERHEQALVFYERLLSDFDTSRYRSAAAFNAGRCLELLDRAEEAAARYRLIADQMERSKDWIDAMFRLAAVLSGLQRPGEAQQVLERLLASGRLGIPDQMDASVLLGEAWRDSGELLRAEHTFRQALRLFRAHGREEYLDPAPAARAEFRLAELATGRFEAAPLRLPEATMQADLEAKAQLLLSAQGAYLRTMRWGDPEWATASGYRIGKLYLDLYAALDTAPMPEDLGPDEVGIYRELLRQRLGVLLRKALKVFELTLQLAERTRADNAWTRAARTEMERVEQQVLGQLPQVPQTTGDPAGEPANKTNGPEGSDRS